MRYTRLSTYEITNGTFDELTGIVEKDMLPTFAKEPGFVDHGLIDVGNHKVVALSIWETREAGPALGRHGCGMGQADHRRPRPTDQHPDR